MSEEAFRPELVTPIRHNKPKPQPHDENNYHNIPEIFQLPRDVFVDLYTKAHLFEQLHPDLLSSPQDASGTPGISGNKSARRYFVSNDAPIPMLQPVGNKGPLADRTLIIAPLPLSLKSCDLIHSIVAPGGIRQIHFAPLPGSQFQVAVITFITAAGATAYKKYFDGNGFFLSIRQKDNSEEGLLGRDGETRTKVMQTGPEGRGVKKVFLVKKHMVSVCVRFWGKDMDGGFLPEDHRLRLEVENELTKWFALDDTWFTDLDEEVRKKGATRVLKVMDAVDVVTAQLNNCKFSRKDNVGGGCNLEFVTYSKGSNNATPTRGRKTEVSTMLRFFSLREAVMAKRYFDLRKGFENKSFYSRDMSDRDIKTLNWTAYSKVGEPSKFEKKKAQKEEGHVGVLGFDM